MRVFTLASTALMLAIAPNAQAKGILTKDLEAKSAISAVTVHPDAATLTREASVDLPAGASTIVFKNLPFGLDPASLRVSGEASGRLEIGAVETRAAPAETRGADTAIEARLKALRSAREAVQAMLDALAAKQAMALRYSQASPERLSPETKPLSVGEWGAAFDAIGATLARTGEELRLARDKAREIDTEIHALEAGGGRPLALGPAREVAVGVESASAGRARIVLGYLVPGAGWTPAYDARLDTGDKDRKPALDLVRRAMVTQRTGEDWTEVALAVSTVRAQRGAAAPEVQPQRVAFYDYPVPMAAESGTAYRADKRALSKSLGAAAPAGAPPLEDEAARPEPAQQQVATLEATAYEATFKVSGTASVPSDGSTKSFALSSRKIEPKLTIRAAPALDQSAYLEARIVNDEDAPLLPGQIFVRRDGVYVGQARLALVAPGEAAAFGFGADDKVKVTRIPIKIKENEPTWFGQTKTETRDFKTSVKNLHGFPIHVTVVDQIPFSENTAITVETLPQTTAPSEKQLADKRGVMAWSFDAQPGETKEIRLAYRVKWPADRDVVTQPAPLAGR
jgi:uncharacterized protein (TIGR02231 family)